MSATPSDLSPNNIRQLASSHGLTELPSSRDIALMFENGEKERITVYPTTRTVRTDIHHPKSGKNSLWRSGVYSSLDELQQICSNPRTHTGLGYRSKNEAPCMCSGCDQIFLRPEYTENQWRKRNENKQLCKKCVDHKQGQRAAAELEAENKLIQSMRKVSMENPEDELILGIKQINLDVSMGGDGAQVARTAFESSKKPRREKTAKPLTATNLERLDKQSGEYERRQFNCPNHKPAHLFFKQVPTRKPVASCPQCKGRSCGQRLEAVPIEEERGYGLFRCKLCNSSWGSSNACRALAQFCVNSNCQNCISDTPILPFRIDAHKKTLTRTAPDGSRYRFKRAPPAPSVPEGESVNHAFEDRPQAFNPNDNRGYSGRGPSRSSASSDGSSGGSWQLVDPDLTSTGQPKSPSGYGLGTNDYVPARRVPGARHRCTGCASGSCSKRFPPVSALHISSGSTASTCSARTFSTVDMNEYQDRDA